MAIQTEKDLSDNARALWLKARSAIELRNYGYAERLSSEARDNLIEG